MKLITNKISVNKLTTIPEITKKKTTKMVTGFIAFAIFSVSHFWFVFSYVVEPEPDLNLVL